MNSESLTLAEPSWESHPLSPLQQGMLFHYLVSEDQGFDVVQLVISLREVVDKALLKEAWRRVVARHASLRSAFQWRGCVEPRQVVHSGIEVPWQEHNWLQVPPAGREQHLASFLVEDRRRGIQMDSAESWRLALVRWESEEFSLVWTFHHALLDGRSFVTVVREVFAFYDASKNGEVPALPAVRSYEDYLEWMARQDFSLSEPFWRSLMSGFAAPTPLPAKAAAEKVGAQKKRDLAVQLSKEFTTRLGEFAHSNGITLNTLAQGVWALLLSRHSGEEDIVFGGTRACRKSSVEGVESMVGLFINTLPVRVEVRPENEIAAWLRGLRRQWVEMRDHEHTPLSSVQSWSDVPRGLPLFNSIVVFDNASPNEILRSGGEAWLNRDVRVFEQTTFPLTLAIQGGEKLRLQIGYHTDQYSEDAAARMLGHLQVLLEAIIEPGFRKLGDLPMLTADERHQLLSDWNKTEKDYGNKLCVHELVELQAKRTPDRIALTCEGSSCSYGELNAKANHVARLLQKMGVGRGSFVPLLLDEGIDLVIAELAIMKAGAAFVPLDPKWPAMRIQSTLQELPHAVMLTGKAAPVDASGLSGRVLPVCRDELPRLERNPASGVQLMDPIYLLFTSGSTGKPKGAINHHAGIANRFFNMNDRFGCGETDVILATTSHVFDSSVWQFFWPLTNGGRVVIPSSRGSSDPQYLLELMTRERVTVTDFVPTLLAAITDQMDEDASLSARLSSLRHILVGGEAIIPAVAYRFKAHLPGTGVTNAYGPTETSIGVIFYELPKEPVDSLPIGKPLRNVCAVILDQNLNLAPVGAPGDLYIGGICVGLGYLNNEEATRAAFIPNPFAELNSSSLYRTGDRARFLPDGNIAFLGRLDAQVKVRGFRIELGDVESALRDCCGVRECAVLAREYEPGERRLVAYVVPVDAQSISAVGEWKDELKQKLPAYMVPSAFVTLEKLPLTASGKIDRKALPAPELSRSQCGEDFVPPRTPIEEEVAAIWETVLKVGTVGVHDNFFELGGHSLLAMRVMARIRGTLGLELSLRDLFERPTIAGLASGLNGAGKAGVRPLAPFLRTEAPKLSSGQERLWLTDQMEPNSVVNNVPFAFVVAGEPDAAALERSVQAIVTRHEALRTTFQVMDGQPVQVIAPKGDVRLSKIDLSALAGSEQEAEVRREVMASVRTRFDLASGPLLRCSLLRLDPTRHLLLFTVHHTVFDDWSLGVFTQELSAFYAAFSKGGSVNLPALSIQCADHASWQHEWLKSPEMERQVAYWRKQLAAVATLQLPLDRARPLRQTHSGKRHSFILPAELAAKLKAFNSQESAMPFMSLLGAFQVLLSRYSGQNDIPVGTPIANRQNVELENLIGCFVNMLVIRGDLSDDPSFQDVVRRARRDVLDAFQHQDLPFEKLVKELNPERDLGLQPLFQVMFEWEITPAHPLALAGMDVKRYPLPTESAHFDLELHVWEEGDNLVGSFVYNADLFEPPTIERMGRHYQTLLEGLVSDPSRPVSEVPMLTPVERHQMLVEWNDTATEYPANKCIHELFEEQVEETPGAVAVVFKDEQFTYQEINARANMLADHLRGLGVGPGEPVGIRVDRSPKAVVGLLGILKAGGAYVPINKADPVARWNSVLKTAGVRFLVADGPPGEGLPEGVELVMIGAAHEGRCASNPERIGKPDNMACVFFTSGSTGIPKGVAVPHRAVLRLLFGVDYVRLGREEVILQMAPLSFDAATFELWGALLHGGRCVLFPERVPTVAALGMILQRHGVTTLWLTSALFNLVIDEAPEILRNVRQLLAGGEALSVSHVRRAVELLPRTQLINGYGPTEGTTFTCCHTIRERPGGQARSIPIGKPVSNTKVFVLDSRLNPQPVGVPGELHIGGDGLALGYLNLPELTAEKFIASPFPSDSGARLYKSGDLVRRLPDGDIEFLGRLDDQLKIRGFRVEPGEIETLLAEHPHVRHAVVSAREYQPGDRRLVAHVVPGAQTPGAAELREFLKSKLPEHMVPSVFSFLDALPLTPSGKIDRRKLPEPDFTELRNHASFEPPRTDLESRVASLWAEALKHERIGRRDDFFQLGGHSLLAVIVIHRLRPMVGLEVPLSLLFEHPDVAGFSKAIETFQKEASAGNAPRIQRMDRARKLPSAFHPSTWRWLSEVTGVFPYELDGDLDLHALERAMNELTALHEILRTTFPSENGLRLQKIEPFRLLELQITDLTSTGNAETKALQIVEEADRQGLDPTRDWPFRMRVLRIADRKHWLVLIVHHVAYDEWSMGVLLRELSSLYEAFLRGEPSPLQPPELQFADFTLWRHDWMTNRGDFYQAQISYWETRLSGGLEMTDVPIRPRSAARSAVRFVLDRSETLKRIKHTVRDSLKKMRPVPEAPNPAQTVIPFEISPGLSQRLKEFSQREGVTLFTTLLAAFKALLHVTTEKTDIAIKTLAANRDQPGLQDIVGYVADSVLLRTSLTGNPTFLEVLNRVRETVHGALAHHAVPYVEMTEELRRRGLDVPIEFPVVFQVITLPWTAFSLAGVTTRNIDVPARGIPYGFQFVITDHGTSLTGSVRLNTTVYDRAAGVGFLSRYRKCLEIIEANHEIRLSDLRAQSEVFPPTNGA